MNVAVCTIEPFVAVTVTVYVPLVVLLDVLKVRVAVPDPFAVSTIVEALRVVLGMLLVVGLILVVSVVVPEKL